MASLFSLDGFHGLILLHIHIMTRQIIYFHALLYQLLHSTVAFALYSNSLHTSRNCYITADHWVSCFWVLTVIRHAHYLRQCW